MSVSNASLIIIKTSTFISQVTPPGAWSPSLSHNYAKKPKYEVDLLQKEKKTLAEENAELREQIRRQEDQIKKDGEKIGSLNNVVAEMQENQVMSGDTAYEVKQSLKGFPLEILISEMKVRKGI